MTYKTLSDLFKGICDAIRTKKGTSGDIDHQDIPSEIESIQGGIDTSDATATAYDIAAGVTAYANGEKVTGRVLTVEPYTLMTLREGYIGTNYSDPDNPRILSTYMEDGSGIFMRNNSTIAISHSASDFGDAQASDVAAGKTFTSVAGVKVEGTGIASNPQTVIHGVVWDDDRTLTLPRFGNTTTAFFAYNATLDATLVMGGYVDSDWLNVVTYYNGYLEEIGWTLSNLPDGISVTVNDGSYVLTFNRGDYDWHVCPAYFAVTCG